MSHIQPHTHTRNATPPRPVNPRPHLRAPHSTPLRLRLVAGQPIAVCSHQVPGWTRCTRIHRPNTSAEQRPAERRPPRAPGDLSGTPDECRPWNQPAGRPNHGYSTRTRGSGESRPRHRRWKRAHRWRRANHCGRTKRAELRTAHLSQAFRAAAGPGCPTDPSSQGCQLSRSGGSKRLRSGREYRRPAACSEYRCTSRGRTMVSSGPASHVHRPGRQTASGSAL